MGVWGKRRGGGGVVDEGWGRGVDGWHTDWRAEPRGRTLMGVEYEFGNLGMASRANVTGKLKEETKRGEAGTRTAGDLGIAVLYK